MKKKYRYDICIIGGLGHVGLPLGIVFANKNQQVVLHDLDKKNANIVFKEKKLPYVEHGASKLLKIALNKKKIHFSSDINIITQSKNIIIAIGTPVDKYLNPEIKKFLDYIKKIKKLISNEQNVIIRSSVFPNTCLNVHKILGKNKNLAYCPERIVQGYSVMELSHLPQLISGFNEKAINNAKHLFKKLTPKIIICTVMEAEFAKLFTNSMRYIEFGLANQYYMICKNNNVNYDRVRAIMTEGYDRVTNLPSAGFAAGPCLFKDTMQLNAFNNNNFLIGNAAMMINEGLPNYLVQQIKNSHSIRNKNIGILGMAFKANIDDTRDSLSFKLRKLLISNGCNVFCTDEYAKDSSFYSLDYTLNRCSIIIIGVPHKKYSKIKFPKNKILYDLWNCIKRI